jgi:hypothetical protein
MATLEVLATMASEEDPDQMPGQEMSTFHSPTSAVAKLSPDPQDHVANPDHLAVLETRDHLDSLAALGLRDHPDLLVNLDQLETPGQADNLDAQDNLDLLHPHPLDALVLPAAPEPPVDPDSPVARPTMVAQEALDPKETPDSLALLVLLATPVPPVELEIPVPLEAATTALQPVWPLDIKPESSEDRNRKNQGFHFRINSLSFSVDLALQQTQIALLICFCFLS